MLRKLSDWFFPFRTEKIESEITFIVKDLPIERVKSGKFIPFDKCDKETRLEDVSKKYQKEVNHQLVDCLAENGLIDYHVMKTESGFQICSEIKVIKTEE